MQAISSKQKAKSFWDHIGTNCAGIKNVDNVLKWSDIDYEVTFEDIYVNKKAVPDVFAISRNDKGKVFGIVKNRYLMLQNHELALLFDESVKACNGTYLSAGAIRHGEIAWIMARLPESITLQGKKINFNMLCTNVHDGKHSGNIMFIPAVDGENILTASKGSCLNKIQIRHHVNYAESIAPEKVVAHKKQYIQKMSKLFVDMSERQITDNERDQFFNMVVTDKRKISIDDITTKLLNKIGYVSDYYLSHPTMNGIRGTALSLFYAVAGYYHNVKQYPEGPEKRFNNIFYEGDAIRDTTNAFHHATMLV